MTAEGTKPLPDKVEAIENFPKPKTVKEMRQFLWMLNFYRRFIPGATEDQAKLNDTLRGPKKRGKTYCLDTRFRRRIPRTKNSLSRATLLAHPDPQAELFLITDAFDNAMGAVIQQKCRKDWQPLAFMSKKFSPVQKRYSPYDRKLLTIYSAVKHFRHLLERRNFTIFTDHKLLIYSTKIHFEVLRVRPVT